MYHNWVIMGTVVWEYVRKVLEFVVIKLKLGVIVWFERVCVHAYLLVLCYASYFQQFAKSQITALCSTLCLYVLWVSLS